MNNSIMSIFEKIYDNYKIDKPIRLIEMFAGYGSQALALKYLELPFEHYKISEWAIKSIQAYKDMHFTNIEEDYTSKMSKEDLVEYFKEHNISSNYNNPLDETQIKRLSDKQLRNIYNNMKITNNLGSIVNIKGKDLEIEDKEDYCYILTYSFPCQDLSLAGKGKGMSDTSTRSGMLWEVERILKELKETNSLPQVLLMENVPQVHSVDNTPDFNKWQIELTKLGYKNYWEDLIATDYGIPQTRNRTFMVSILGDYNYTFPKPIPLEKKLKDMLEDNVDEKYFLSDKMKEYIFSEDDKYKVNKNSLKLNREIACSKTTREGNTRADTSDYITNEIYGTYDFSSSERFLNGKERFEENKGTFPTLRTTPKEGIVNSDLRIRKLTPKECFRLMGVKDEDFEKVKVNQSDSSLYHLAGDSIVVNVLMAIFKEMI